MRSRQATLQLPKQLAFNEQLPRSDISSVFGQCAAPLWELPRCSSGDPKGMLSSVFSLITPPAPQVHVPMTFRYRLTNSWDLSVLADNPKANAISPCFRHAISPQVSSGQLAPLLQEALMPVRPRFGLQALQDSLWWKQWKLFSLHFFHLYLLRILLTAFSFFRQHKQLSICIFFKTGKSDLKLPS